MNEMMNDTMRNTEFEIRNVNDHDDQGLESLNIDDLDIDELERRLELATATADSGCYVRITPSDSGPVSE